jgi:predicted O-methyltransferase YrrM
MAIRTESECTEPELDALVRAMLACNPKGRRLEIGTAAGGALKRMMLAYPARERPPFVVVDPMTYFPGQRETVEANLASAGLDPAAVEFRVETSASALAKALRVGERFDFILIDGNHALRAATGDLRWTRLLSPNGVVCLHDYEQADHIAIPGVKLALDAFLAKRRNYALREVVGAMAIVEKLDWGAPEVGAGEMAAAWGRQVALRWRHSFGKRLPGLCRAESY